MDYTALERIDKSQEQYFGDTNRFSASQMKEIIKAEMDTTAAFKKMKSSRSMVIGSAVDTLITEPEQYALRFGLLDPGQDVPTTKLQELFVEMVVRGMSIGDAHAKFYKRTSADAAKKLYDSLEQFIGLTPTFGDKVLTVDEAARVDGMYDNLVTQRDLPILRVRREDRQVVFHGEASDGETTIGLKGMVDLLMDEELVDLKTTGRIADVQDNIHMFLYDLQLLHYARLSRRPRQVLLFQESVEPFAHVVVDITKLCAEPAVSVLLDDVLGRIMYSVRTDNWGKREDFEK